MSFDPRVSIVSAGTDDELVTVQNTITGMSTASDRTAVYSILSSLKGPITTVDLIGHSASSILQIGTWSLDSSASGFFDVSLQDVLSTLKVANVRLLGCSTGVAGDPWNAMQAIATVLDGITIFGTQGAICAENDFNSTGFTSTDVLVPYTPISPDKFPPERPATDTFPKSEVVNIPLHSAKILDEKVHLLPWVSWPRITPTEDHARTLLKQIDGRHAWSVAGLLAEPEVELLMPTGIPGLVHRFQVLINSSLVRVYTKFPYDGHGLLYRVPNPAAFAALLSVTGFVARSHRKPSSKK